jgi:RsmE family RNA methyltransferase
LIKVLRVRTWDEIIFFNWVDDIDYIYKIISIDKREVYLEKQWYLENNSEIDFDINIINSIPNKLEKIELILQKWVEVGVSNFLFFRSNRSQKLVLSPNKIERLNRIIIEAVEQSWRSRIPEFTIVDDLDIWAFSWANNIIFHTQNSESISLKDLDLNKSQDRNYLICYSFLYYTKFIIKYVLYLYIEMLWW